MAPNIKPVEYLLNKINGKYFYTAWRGVKNVSKEYWKELELVNTTCK